MIVARLAGGLGNQMFQYAAGFALAHRNSDSFSLDTTAFHQGPGRGETLRALGIEDFQISAPVLSKSDAYKRRNPYGPVSKAFRFLRRKIFRQYFVDWHPDVMKRSGDVYLEGYFQSERYFESIPSLLRREFSLRESFSRTIEGLARDIEIGPGTPVSLHVRRGDYVSNSRNAAILDICTPDYYSRAVDHLASIVSDMRLVIFSDDIEWVLSNIPESRSALYLSSCLSDSGQTLLPSQEMALMASCRHHIISNSTFSWWGAYLNPRAEKLVVAPSRWTNGSEFDHKNILPPDWIRLMV